MANSTLPEGVKSEVITWHLADGTPTDDTTKATTVEVVRTYKDGRVEHRLMGRSSLRS